VSIPQAGSGLFSPCQLSMHHRMQLLFQSLKREAASLAITSQSMLKKERELFQSLKREAASLANCRGERMGAIVMVSIPQAGSGLFSLLCF
ncbi:MAG: hypothetical protein ACRDIV_18335, partial [Ktedonobacteraceae bacterium]